MASLIKSIRIDFDAVEYEMEERGERIDWDEAGDDKQKAIYKLMNEEAIDMFEDGTYGNIGLMEALVSLLRDYCDEFEVPIIELDEDGNEIETENEDDAPTEGEIIYEKNDEAQN